MSVSAVFAGTFGSVVTIGGLVSDLALDEKRGVVYVANYTGNRIEVVSMANRAVQTTMTVAAYPGALAISPDGRYLVVGHYGPFKAPFTSANSLTVLNLEANTKQTFAMGNPPLAVAFGSDGLALVVTTTEFLLFDPATGSNQKLETVSGLAGKTLPVPPATYPPEILKAASATSADGRWIYGTIEAGAETSVLVFSYEVTHKILRAPTWITSPVLGPRAVSVARNGSAFMTGWGLFTQSGILLAEMPGPSGILNYGSHSFDSARGTIYAQFPDAGQQVAPKRAGGPVAAQPASAPVLLVLDSDNLAVRERLKLAENLAGRSMLSANGDVMYAVSESGLTVLPVGSLNSTPRVAARQEDLMFRGSVCDQRPMTKEIEIVNPGGGATDFSVTPSMSGITVSPTSGTTPAKVTVTITPSVFQNQKGTLAAALTIASRDAVNVPPPVRVLINNREPDQRGTAFNVPGKLVDLLADPARNRFYVLRQDKNQVLVFDAATYSQIATLRTGNTPMSMALTFDRQYLMVGNDDSQLANVFDLDTLQPDLPIVFPTGHYPRSIAASGGAILAASRVAGPVHTIDRIDMVTHSASTLPTLGIFENKINVNTVLAASPSGSSIFIAQPDGTVMLYDSNQDSFPLARKDVGKLAGAYAALSGNRYVAGNFVLNEALMPVGQALDASTGTSSGFAMVDQQGVRTTAPDAAKPGVIQRIDLTQAAIVRPTRLYEAPALGGDAAPFTRTLAPLANRAAIVSLSTSGILVLPWNYDAAVADPRIDGIVNAADGSAAVAPGGLVTITGRDLSLVNAATQETPLPTALGDSCLTVNGVLMPMILVSPTQINGQLPFNVSGDATIILRTPGGVSNSFRFTIQPVAPSVILTPGPAGGLVPAVVRDTNHLLVTLSNPIHVDDWITIYLTGLGGTTPAVDSGSPGPSDILATALVAPEVRLGDKLLDVNWAGMAPGQVGVYQINAFVSRDSLPLGMEVPLTISQGEFTTSVPVRVVR